MSGCPRIAMLFLLPVVIVELLKKGRGCDQIVDPDG